ncbi:serine hydrolase domain-containing protein [Paenibacillus eucommiae]|uniref:CubicO group peptidase (Beta-lactamase class C family) n=1 Tax=Paenibacillus eucommiae TaxID=1355755 RepID=A0ABS4J835_9BACL|nr:serine hydrolase [Paenibacillus eucommiae]MBP1995410.1 CubicO group peptidase (beta-lactamase class C family) [Paenibacillus eucommiae]
MQRDYCRDYWPTAEWRTQNPATLGMDIEKLSELDPMIKAQYSGLSGIVVAHKGYMAFEKYYNGCGPNDTHHVASVTKSITSALIGIAIDTGCIKSVDEKVLDFFPEYVSGATDIQKRGVTIRHLLTMTAPFPFTWKPGGGVQEPLDRLRRQKDWVKYGLDLLGQKGRPGAFQYCTAGAHLLSAILTRTTGKSAREFASERLFGPIGMQPIPDFQMKSFGLEDVFGNNLKGWIHDPNGNSTGGWGITLTPRDMARFGFLYLNGGSWDDKQIISRTWIDDSLAMNSNKYGYLWWLHEEDGIFAYLAMGDGGNAICCIPDKDLIVAITSKIVSKPRDIWALIKNGILASVVGC